MSTTKPTQTPATAARSPFPAALTTQIVCGAACWVLTLTFFVGQAVTQFTLRTPYSLTTNEISDLGSTRCGPLTVLTYHADVCSPLHGVMNGTFIAVGLLTLLGIIDTRRAWPRRRLTSGGLVFLALGARARSWPAWRRKTSIRDCMCAGHWRPSPARTLACSCSLAPCGTCGAGRPSSHCSAASLG